MDGKKVEDWRTVYYGARLANMVFILDDGGFDCFDAVKFNAMTDQINELKEAICDLMVKYEIPATDYLKKLVE